MPWARSQNLAPGDRVASPVAAWGYAESTTAPADYTAKVPAGLSAEVAASSLLQGITAHYLLTSVYPWRPVTPCWCTPAPAAWACY